jgi:hypothetical protein
LRLSVDERSGSQVHYVDVCTVQQGDVVRLPQQIIDDLYSGLVKMGCRPTDYLSRGIKQIERPEFYAPVLTSHPAKDGSYEVAAWANSLDERSLTQLTKIGVDPVFLEKDLKTDATGLSLDAFKRLIFNVLLLLANYELEAIILRRFCNSAKR